MANPSPSSLGKLLAGTRTLVRALGAGCARTCDRKPADCYDAMPGVYLGMSTRDWRWDFSAVGSVTPTRISSMHFVWERSWQTIAAVND